MKTGAFFDLDHTLLNVNSAVQWGRLMFFKRVLPLNFFLIAGFYGSIYKLGLYPFDLLMKKAIGALKGRSAKKTIELTKKYFEEKKDSFYIQKMLDQVRMHKLKNHELVIITQSFDFIAKIFARDLGIKHLVSTEVEIKNKKFTGKVRPCVSYRKDDIMNKLAERLGVDLKKSYAYTDSLRDIEMLENVRHKYVINPGPRLGLIAKTKKWTVWRIK